MAKALHEVWPQETIPFVYYAICRFIRDVAGDDVLGLRWTNFPPMLAVLAWFWSVWRGSPQRRVFLALFAILSFCGKTTFTYFPYFRDYYWQWAAETIFVGAAVCDRLDGRGTVNPWLIAATPFVFCLHQVTAVYAAAFSGLLVINEARQRHFTRLFALIGAAVVGLIPLAWFAWLQHVSDSSAYHLVDWIPRLGPSKRSAPSSAGLPRRSGRTGSRRPC